MVKRRRLPDRQRPLAVGSLALAGLAGLAAYALWYEPAMCLRLVRWRVALPGWHGRHRHGSNLFDASKNYETRSNPKCRDLARPSRVQSPLRLVKL